MHTENIERKTAICEKKRNGKDKPVRHGENYTVKVGERTH